MLTRRHFVQLASAASACSLARQGRAQTPASADVSGPRSLRAHAEAKGLLAGCAVVPQRLAGEAAYSNVVAAQTNLLVAENAMKWRAIHPAPDRFDFTGADAIMAFAKEHEQKVRGHNLCWHESIPDWFAGTLTKDNARQILTQHIETVAGRYAGRLHSWDVVNEAIDPKSGRADALRTSPWLDLIGPDYIELAFRTARHSDPQALLTYNDYGIENESEDSREKRARVLALVRKFKASGVPIDAVGIQSHLSVTDPAPGAGLREFVRELRKMNLQVFVTELDVNERKLSGSIEQRDAAIARLYKDYVAMMVAEPNVTAVLTWGITDRFTWLDGAKYARLDGQPQRCLPFDADYRPAPVFFSYREAFDSSAARG